MPCHLANVPMYATLLAKAGGKSTDAAPDTDRNKEDEMDIIDFAMQMELDGKAHYEKLAAMTPVPGLKQILSILAIDEQDHYEVMKGMKTGILTAFASSTALETAQNIFPSIRIDEQLLAELRTKIDAYRYAIQIEADSIALYEDMLKKGEVTTTPAAVALLMKVIDEEQKHYNIVENIHDLIAEYDHFLAWRDFDKVRKRGIV
jgi:rubrerythrin